MRHYLRPFLILIALITVCSLAGPSVVNAANRWNAGAWDSSIDNLAEHPHTVGVRIKVVDAENRIPVKEVQVKLTGKYLEEKVGRSGDEVGIPREPQEREFELKAETGKDGVAVFALNWQKLYPWRSYFGKHPPREAIGKGGSYRIKRSWVRAVDDVEKAQKIEIRHPRYQYAEKKLGFGRFLNVGQEKKSATQRPAIFDKFEKAWQGEIKRQNVKFCVLDLGKKFSDFENKKCTRIEFFEKIRAEDWGKLYRKPQNWFSRGDHPQSLCGPYFVYLIEIRMERVKRHAGTKQSDTGEEQGRSSDHPSRTDTDDDSAEKAADFD